MIPLAELVERLYNCIGIFWFVNNRRNRNGSYLNRRKKNEALNNRQISGWDSGTVSLDLETLGKHVGCYKRLVWCFLAGSPLPRGDRYREAANVFTLRPTTIHPFLPKPSLRTRLILKINPFFGFTFCSRRKWVAYESCSERGATRYGSQHTCTTSDTSQLPADGVWQQQQQWRSFTSGGAVSLWVNLDGVFLGCSRLLGCSWVALGPLGGMWRGSGSAGVVCGD